MELEQIKAIVAMMKDNDLSEFSMEQDGLKLRIKRGPEEFQQTVTLPPPAPAQSTAAPAPGASGADQRLARVRDHLRKYRELAAQGKWSEAGKELEAIEAEVKQ